jgi:hypothetical protein
MRVKMIRIQIHSLIGNLRETSTEVLHKYSYTFSPTAKNRFGDHFSTAFARRRLDIQHKGIVSRDGYYFEGV